MESQTGLPFSDLYLNYGGVLGDELKVDIGEGGNWTSTTSTPWLSFYPFLQLYSKQLQVYLRFLWSCCFRSQQLVSKEPEHIVKQSSKWKVSYLLNESPTL